MKGTHAQFSALLNKTVQYRIPVFQRDYLWEESQCAQLFEDIVRIGTETDAKPHFVGSVVTINAKEGTASESYHEWIVIDGQQRLTTLMLLIAALRDHIGETKWVGTDEGPTEARLTSYFLTNEHESKDRRYNAPVRREVRGRERPRRLPARPLRPDIRYACQIQERQRRDDVGLQQGRHREIPADPPANTGTYREIAASNQASGSAWRSSAVAPICQSVECWEMRGHSLRMVTVALL